MCKKKRGHSIENVVYCFVEKVHTLFNSIQKSKIPPLLAGTVYERAIESERSRNKLYMRKKIKEQRQHLESFQAKANTSACEHKTPHYIVAFKNASFVFLFSQVLELATCWNPAVSTPVKFHNPAKLCGYSC